MGSVKRAVKAIATGGYSEIKRQKDKEKAAAKQAEQQQKELEEQTQQAEKKVEQQTAKTRQESADLASLAEQSDRNSYEMGGILTTTEGLVPGERKLNRKQKLGG